MAIDIITNRAERKWTRSEQLGRVLWALARPLFRFSPRLFWGWRRMILRLFGAKIGSDVHVYPSVRVTIPWNIEIGDKAAVGDYAILYALGPICIGERATVSQYAHLCAGTHDWRDPAMRLIKAPLVIGNDAWICANAFVGPGVVIGANAIVGAGAVTMKNVDDSTIVVGNPAQVLGKRSESGIR
ncbi:LbetaH domain-containing protein [Henriciella algicola]|uniref:Acetyltransferase n=1 Tax=Henriciella algicola TaxID=1608422 RepID=A0A399RFA5_9PROT|nr:acetyltransferase [Henriciella algicola]RIJ29201.1 acetyltransferase [Henriciella algicola]